ncbi:hypothetical protein V2J09_008562 [Rumex salicifolius]
MANDAALRTALMWLAAAVVAVGVATQSVKKMGVTYVAGMVGIAGVLLPDWEFFDRDVSKWFEPLAVQQINPGDVHRLGSNRFRFYPIRTTVYALVYGYGIYKWWNYITH